MKLSISEAIINQMSISFVEHILGLTQTLVSIQHSIARVITL